MLPTTRIRSRRRLLAATVLFQVVALTIGGYALYAMTRSQLVANLQGEVYAQNARTARRVSWLIERSGVRSLDQIEYASEQWEQLQDIIEETQLPAGAYVCLLDKNGEIFCHPRLRSNPSLRRINLGNSRLKTDDGSIRIGDPGTDPIVSGRLVMGFGDVHYITMTPLGNDGARLLVHQPESGIHSFNKALTTGTFWIAIGIMFTVVGLTSVLNGVLLRRYDTHLDELNRSLESDLNDRTRDAVVRLHALVTGLAELVEHRDNDTGTHLERICSYSCLLAEALREQFDVITDEWISCLRLAAPLHDIGKVAMPDSVLRKPGKLNEQEWKQIRRHPGIGADMLCGIRDRLGADPLIDMAIDVTRSHHERWDGAGYPDQLSKERIPLSARIVALADVYDALTSKRVYKAEMPHDEAVQIILEGSGTQFDPRIVEAFERAATIFESIKRGLMESRLKMTDTGRVETRAA